MIYAKKLTGLATIPILGTPLSAGYDLHAVCGGRVRARQRELVSTGIAVELPMNSAGIIKPRSGLAVKHGIDVMAGVIDEDYRGEIKVLLINHSDVDYYFEAGDRIAQLIITSVFNNGSFVESDLSPSSRGDGGFGSTGK